MATIIFSVTVNGKPTQNVAVELKKSNNIGLGSCLTDGSGSCSVFTSELIPFTAFAVATYTAGGQTLSVSTDLFNVSQSTTTVVIPITTAVQISSPLLAAGIAVAGAIAAILYLVFKRR